MRIISICPSNTELLAYLGLMEQVIAIDDFSDWPHATKKLTKVGPDLSINMDKIEQLQPDLVVASLSVPGMERNVKELKRRSIPHIVLNPNSLEEIKSDIHLLGEATNSVDRANEVTKKYIAFIDTYKELSLKVTQRPTLYWEWWPKPVFTPGRTNWLTEISTLAGGQNIFADVNLASVQTDWDDVLNRNPDHICLSWVGVKQDKVNPSLVRKRPQWDSMPAIQENRIHVLEEPLFCRPSPRLLLGLKKVASILHPNLYPKYDGFDPLLGLHNTTD
ncbi:cobalamin-binding protein [Bacillus timonensis]|nr:cobalamin-binding protein [Bacillus timonensis]